MKRLKLFFACLLMAVLSIGQVWGVDISFGYGQWDGVTASFSGTTKDEVTQTVSDVVVTYTRNGASLYANQTSLRFYQKNTLKFEAPSGYNITEITFTGSGWKSDVTTDEETCTATTSALSWSGEAASVTFTRPNGASSYATLTGASVTLAATGGGGSNNPTISAGPESAKYGVDDAATALSVTAAPHTSGKTLSYQWYSNTTNTATVDNNHKISGATNSTYTPSVSTAGTKYYYCVVSEQDGGSTTSSVAAIVVATPQTIAQIMPTGTGTTSEGDEFLLNDVTVTYANGKNIYVKDASGYILVYDNNSAISGAANGKVLHGLWGKAKLYNGLPEVSTITQASTPVDGSAVDPIQLDAFPTTSDLNKYVVLDEVTFASAQTLNGTVGNNFNGTFKNQTLAFRNSFTLSGVSLKTGTSYRVVGIVNYYNALQFYPISFEEKHDPTMTVNPTALDFGTIGVGDDAPDALTFTVSGSYLTANLSASLTAGSDLYDFVVTTGSLNKNANNEVSATITVTPKTAINAAAGTKAGEITVTDGDALSQTVSLTTEVKAKYTVTWNNNGSTSTTQVLDGEKPAFPATPVACDATSTVFVGWATAPWEDKIATLAGQTVYTAASAMPEVTTDDVVYYAVFAKGAGGNFDGTNGGTFKIYAIDNESEPAVKYYATNTVSSNKLTTTTTADDAQEFTFAKDGDYWTISYTSGEKTLYLTAPESNSGNISAFSETACNWKIESGEYGSWRIWSRSTNNSSEKAYEYRALMHNMSDGFKNYCPSNQYLDCEIGSGADMTDYMTTCCEAKAITIASPIANGSVSADLAEACEGKIVTLTPTADPAYHFDAWDVYKTGESATKVTVTSNQFTMPAYAVTVSASFAHDACVNLDAPTLNGTIEPTYNSATIAWNEVDDAEEYAVSVVNHATSESVFAGNVDALSKALENLEPETQYDYTIMAVGDGIEKCADGNTPLEGNFTTAKLPTYTLTLSENGQTSTEGTHGLGVLFDLPTSSSQACAGMEFVGWSEDADADAAEDLISGQYSISEDKTIFAVYAEVTPGATTYTLTPAASMSEGVYVIAAHDENYKALTGGVLSGKLVNETTGFAIDDNKIVSLPEDACEFTFTAVTGGYSIQKPNDDYLGYTSTSDNNKLAFGTYATLVWSVNANVKDGYPEGGVSLTTSAYKVSANASTGSDTWVRGYKSSGSIYNPIYLFKKTTGASSATNYTTTCIAAPEATPDPASLDVVAAGASGTITVTYDNVNTEGVTFALSTDESGSTPFSGDWLEVNLDGSKNITYTIAANNTYAARTAYIRLTAPAASGTGSVTVPISVTQAKYIPEFTSLADLVAADPAIPSGTDVKISFSHIKISDDIAIISGQRKGVYLDQKAANDKDIEIYYAASPYVPAGWVKNGFVSATDLVVTWTHYTQYSNDVWELIPTKADFNWESDLTYEGPAASQISVSPSGNIDFATVEQGADLPEGKTLTVTLTNVEAAKATLVGSNFSINKTDLADGDEITVSVVSTATAGEYSATLTISDKATENPADPVVISVTFTVETAETPVSTTSQWVPATEITNGMQVLIVGERNEKIYAVGAQTSNNRTAVEGSLSEGVFTPGENTMAFTVVAQEGGTYALQASNGKYLYAAGSGSGKNYLRSQDEVDDNAKWTLSVSSATANGTNTNNKLQLNNSSDIFSCYSSTQKAIALYVPKQDTPEPVWEELRAGATSGKYYTVCLSKNVTDFRGGNFWNMSKRNGSSIAYLEEVTTDDLPLAKGTPYIFEVTGAKMEVVYEGAETNAAGTNGALVGTFASMDQDALNTAKANNANSDIYLLSGNKLWNVTTTGASGNSLAAGRAYIVYDQLTDVSEAPHAPGKRVRAVPMQGQTATGVDALNASETPVKMIIDGQMYILRGEKMYDATGKLVK